jgi:A/G-specific adenine glycosylase
MNSDTSTPFADAVLAWFDQSGRRNLPWQSDPTPYRVWVSEIMLQQTQVTTVIPFFRSFLERFPDVHALAAAPIDEVLHRWSGLGYYARARNLHRAAVRIVAEHGGEFPRTLEEMISLPGIGRSTAGAILSLARDERYPILDGNVKRVLARYFGVEGFSGAGAVSMRLWALAEECTPHAQLAAYTQAIMDLGATVCVRRRPLCAACPISSNCVARATGRQHELPAPRPRAARRLKRTCMLIAVHEGRVLLERRPPDGIWGGLWGLPEFANLVDARLWSERVLANGSAPIDALAPVRHAFTHFDLDIEPLRIECAGTSAVMEADRWVWYNPAAPAALGVAAPVSQLIRTLVN